MNLRHNKNILITRDSTMSIPANEILARVIQRIQKEIRCFESLGFYHVLRVHNKHANKLGNSTYRLAKGALKCKKWLFIEQIPYIYTTTFLIFSMSFMYQLMRQSIVNSNENEKLPLNGSWVQPQTMRSRLSLYFKD